MEGDLYIFQEVYYKHYAENWNDKYWEKGERSLLYMIIFPTVDDMLSFMTRLGTDGLECVDANQTYRVLLFNLELKRFAVIRKACKQACLDDREYTPEEFQKEVYHPWLLSQKHLS